MALEAIVRVGVGSAVVAKAVADAANASEDVECKEDGQKGNDSSGDDGKKDPGEKGKDEKERWWFGR